MSMSKRKTKYATRDILLTQTQYLSKVLLSMSKIDWKNQDPTKIALEFPDYMTKVLERFIELTLSLLEYKPDDTKTKDTNKVN